MSGHRLFVAIDPSPDVRARLGAAIDRVRRLAPSAKWVDAGALHVTLAFLGYIEAPRISAIEAAIRDVAARHAAIDLRFVGAGGFGSRGARPRTLWAGVQGDVAALAAAQSDLAKALAALGHPLEERAFTAHLTLARTKMSGGDPALAACASALAEDDFGSTRVEAMVLYESELSPKGPTYTALASLPFGVGG